MKVFEVVEINEGVFDKIKNLINPVDKKTATATGRAGTPFEGMKFQQTKNGRMRITFPNGNVKTVSDTSREALEKVARNYNINHRPQMKVEPRLGPKYSPAPSGKAPKLKVDPTDRIGGKTGLKKDPFSNKISRATSRALLSPFDPYDPFNRPIPDQEEPVQKRDRNPKSKTKNKSFLKQGLSILRNLFSTKILSGPAGALISLGVSIADFEDELDRFNRIATADFEDQIARNVRISQDSWSKETKQAAKEISYEMARVCVNASAGVLPAVLGSYAAIKAPAVAAAAAASAPAVIGGLIALLGTGPAGWIVAIIIGGAVAYGGTQLVLELLDTAGLVDILAKEIETGVFMDPGYIKGLAKGVDKLQNITPDNFSVFGDDPLTISDSIQESKNENTEELRKMIQSDKKLMQAFKKGKEKAKELLKQS